MTPSTALQKIQIILDEKNIKDKEFASLLGASPSTISRILNGKQPLTSHFLSRVEAAFNLPRGFFLEDNTNTETGDQYIPKHMATVRELISYLFFLGFQITKDISIGDNEVYTSNDDPRFRDMYKELLPNTGEIVNAHYIVTQIKKARLVNPDIKIDYTISCSYENHITTLKANDFYNYILNLDSSIRTQMFCFVNHYPKPSMPYYFDEILSEIEDKPRIRE